MSETQDLPATEEEPIGELALRTLAMPADTNPSGDIFGGWLMGQMDIAGGIAAGSRAGGRVATVAVDGFTFHKPVHVGDVVCCYTKILRTGRTSVTIRVQAWTLRRHQADVRIKVTEGNFTFVALDENGNKRLVPDH
ncbi:MAG: acyl-CoA thioesterase [Rhodospirillaceae bacterium]|nr:acyl-CoA thioesterase [Rhodospirillaceae bacterium]MBT6609476.1 acyl-CoA thioesterase [Rhodospirillaceae bacterium]MBT7251106.1 acyl-CoA thioesterase [Rhodospirillaceae bacterium]MBT7509949.1 acyl-CoA thioesterase [Rhodospirillaceae bacterium]